LLAKMKWNTKLLKLSENQKGRDFVVSDIHGCFYQLEEAMAISNFNPDIDRVLSVGDLVNRGPESHRVVEFLRKDWFYAVMGNHDFDTIKMFTGQVTAEEKQKWLQKTSRAWWGEIFLCQQAEIVSELLKLPIVIEVFNKGRPHGIVHGEVLDHMEWNEFNMVIEDERHPKHRGCIEAAIGARKMVRIDSKDVAGVKQVIVGHVPVLEPNRRANVLEIETGAYKKFKGKDVGHLSLINISSID